jgi:hypothetical protein
MGYSHAKHYFDWLSAMRLRTRLGCKDNIKTERLCVYVCVYVCVCVCVCEDVNWIELAQRLVNTVLEFQSSLQ